MILVPWWLPPGRSLGAAFGGCATFTAPGLPIDHWQSSCEPTGECVDVSWIWMSERGETRFEHMFVSYLFMTHLMYFVIFCQFRIICWHPGNPVIDASFPQRPEAMDALSLPRLEAKSENTTLALDRAIAGFLVRSSFNISYLVPWKRWIQFDSKWCCELVIFGNGVSDFWWQRWSQPWFQWWSWDVSIAS